MPGQQSFRDCDDAMVAPQDEISWVLVEKTRNSTLQTALLSNFCINEFRSQCNTSACEGVHKPQLLLVRLPCLQLCGMHAVWGGEQYGCLVQFLASLEYAGAE